MYKKFAGDGLEIVGLESQGHSGTELSDFCKSKNMNYNVTAGGSVKGAVVSGIPHLLLFGADGKLITEDGLRGPGLEKKIASAVQECGAAMAGPGPYTKLAPLALQVKNRQGLGSVLKTLATKKTSKDAAEATEATMMYDALSGNGTRQLESAAEKKSDDPLVALMSYDKIALLFSGHDIGKKATDESAAMKKDPVIKKELEGAVMWKTIEGMSEKLKPGPRGTRDPMNEQFRKINMDALVMMVNGCRTIMQRCPKTKAATKAEEFVEQFKPKDATATK